MKTLDIHIDLDGVALSFSDPVIEKFQFKNIPLNLPSGLYPWVPYESEIREELNELMENYDFWANLKPYPWAYLLINACKKYGEVRFLSRAMPNSGCMAGKMDSILKYFPEMDRKVQLVTGDKFPSSNPNSVLIDDDLNHKEEWIKRGGVFIHWEELKNDLENLKEAQKRIDEVEVLLENREKHYGI